MSYGRVIFAKKLTVAIALVASLLGSIVGGAAAQSTHVVLITTDEAKLPNVTNANLSFRAGVTRGPSLVLLAPTAGKTVQSPIHFALKYEGHGGAEIDLSSLKITYVRNPPVDLTRRLQDFAKPHGIDVLEAEVPAGTHTIRAEIKDKEGRTGFLNFTFNVAP